MIFYLAHIFINVYFDVMFRKNILLLVLQQTEPSSLSYMHYVCFNNKYCLDQGICECVCVCVYGCLFVSMCVFMLGCN